MTALFRVWSYRHSETFHFICYQPNGMWCQLYRPEQWNKCQNFVRLSSSSSRIFSITCSDEISRRQRSECSKETLHHGRTIGRMSWRWVICVPGQKTGESQWLRWVMALAGSFLGQFSVKPLPGYSQSWHCKCCKPTQKQIHLAGQGLLQFKPQSSSSSSLVIIRQRNITNLFRTISRSNLAVPFAAVPTDPSS